MPKLIWVLPFLFCCGCAQNDETIHSNFQDWQEISGRDEERTDFALSQIDLPEMQRLPIYRAKVPANWNRHDPAFDESISDTMKPLCEFKIASANGDVRITIHNFPSGSLEGRIPPSAQIARWKQQFEQLDLTNIITIPCARGGFSGLYFEATGEMHGTKKTVMGMSMQMAAEHYQNLQDHNSKNVQRRADYTIKVQGSPASIEEHRKDLHSFSNSFELIEEIPTR